MSVRCLIIEYPTHKGFFVLSAQFGSVQNEVVCLHRIIDQHWSQEASGKLHEQPFQMQGENGEFENEETKASKRGFQYC